MIPSGAAETPAPPYVDGDVVAVSMPDASRRVGTVVGVRLFRRGAIWVKVQWYEVSSGWRQGFFPEHLVHGFRVPRSRPAHG
jgi:hypothetical protein